MDALDGMATIGRHTTPPDSAPGDAPPREALPHEPPSAGGPPGEALPDTPPGRAAAGHKPQRAGRQHAGWQRAQQAVYLAFVLVLVGFGVWLATIEFEGALGGFVLRFGAVGYLVAAGIAGINVVLPTTHLIFTAPLLNAGLDPWTLVACGAVGATLADGVGYFVGWSGRSAFSTQLSRVAGRLATAVRKRPRLAPLVLFLWAAFAPLPNEVLVVPAGVLGYGILRTALITLAGNVVFNTMAVVLGLAVV